VNLRGSDIALQGVGALVGGVHFEYVIGWCRNHPRAFSENHALQDVYCLCDVCHTDFVAVLVEDVQRQSGDESIADGVLLPEKMSVCSGHGSVPCTPFADAELDAVSRVIVCHDLPVFVYKLLDVHALGEQAVELLGGVFGCSPV